MYRKALRGLDPDPYLIAIDRQNRDDYVVTDSDALMAAPREYEHLRAT
jgi:hypothetical protein